MTKMFLTFKSASKRGLLHQILQLQTLYNQNLIFQMISCVFLFKIESILSKTQEINDFCIFCMQTKANWRIDKMQMINQCLELFLNLQFRSFLSLQQFLFSSSLIFFYLVIYSKCYFSGSPFIYKEFLINLIFCNFSNQFTIIPQLFLQFDRIGGHLQSRISAISFNTIYMELLGFSAQFNALIQPILLNQFYQLFLIGFTLSFSNLFFEFQ
ncbi:unnamed protein product [Paramecium sonneborni]|uniref:Transmembrane protein n=1 Tax=Paramecium sonneborni TaxID=65129 RepID=A0A8S1MQZ6_9CILI|nr:unnamed protein product [Paramecium sonneborni]